MVEAVRRHGYPQNDDRRVVGLGGSPSGTSMRASPPRRSASWRTFDEIVERAVEPVGNSYRFGGGLRERFKAALRGLPSRRLQTAGGATWWSSTR